MYIPSWIDIPLLLLSFMVGYETFRKDFDGQTIRSKRFMLMAVSIVLGGFIAVINRNETSLSLPMFLASLAVFGWGVHMWVTRPAKLPQQPPAN